MTIDYRNGFLRNESQAVITFLSKTNQIERNEKTRCKNEDRVVIELDFKFSTNS